MTVCFIHAADLHLDSPLRGIARYADFPVARLRAASRHAFTRLVDIALEENVDFLVLAGDIWDGDWPDVSTGLYFAREMGRLQRAEIPVYLLRGNHDAESRITRALTLPDNVHIFAADTPQTFYLQEHDVALHGQSFARPDIRENLALTYPDALPNCLNIGVLHTALEGGNPVHEPYAPCRRQHLFEKGYDYWALGHVHTEMSQQDVTSGTTIAYPGVLQGRHIRETGAKGALKVTLNSGEAELTRLLVDVIRWHNLSLEVSAAAALSDIPRMIDGTVNSFLRDHPEVLNDDRRSHVVRISLTGETALHGQLVLEAAQLREEILSRFAAIAPEQLILEKLHIGTRAWVLQTDHSPHQDAVGALTEILDQVTADPAFLQALSDEMRDMVQSLPADVRAALGDINPERMRRLQDNELGELMPQLSQTLTQLLAKA